MPRNQAVNQQMREESRQKILETACQLFAQQGFFNIRIAEIAKAAEMSPGNIYWYFPSKEEILKALLEDYFQRTEAVLIEAESWPGSGLDKVNRLIELELEFLRSNGSGLQIFMSILGHGGYQFIKELGFDTIQIGAGYHRHLAGILNTAIQEGSLPAQDTQVLIMSFYAYFNGLFITYGQDWQRVPPTLIQQAALRLMGRREG